MLEKQGAAKIVMDVAHPGTSLPAPTSKAVLVTNKPAGPDPMVSENTEQKQIFNKLRIEPPQESLPKADGAAEPEVETPSDSAESFTDEPAKKSQAQEDIEYTDTVNKLIESRQYYLPINQVQRRRTKQLVRILLVGAIIIGLGWTYLLLDAGIVSIPGVSVPTHFFK